MLDDTDIKDIGTHKIIGIFGDKNFPPRKGPKACSSRRDAMTKIKDLLVQLKPEVIYIMPQRGFSESIIPIISFLDIPYIVINPFKGFYDDKQGAAKIKLLIALENSRGVVTIKEDTPETISEFNDAYQESLDFILDRSEVIVCVTGNDPSENIVRIERGLFSKDKVIILNYDPPTFI